MELALPKKEKKNHFKLSKLLKVPLTKLKRKLTKLKKISSTLLVMRQLRLKRSLMPSILKSTNSKQILNQTFLTPMMTA